MAAELTFSELVQKSKYSVTKSFRVNTTIYKYGCMVVDDLMDIYYLYKVL